MQYLRVISADFDELFCALVCRIVLTLCVVGFQVGTDPAGDSDTEGSRELLPRADQGADLHVQEQVDVLAVPDVAE